MDNILFNKLINCDEQAQIELFNQKYSQAYNLAYGYVKKHEDAEDVVQLAFISIFQNIHKLNDYSKFDSWMYKIVVNKALTQLASNGKNAQPFSNLSSENEDFDIEEYIKYDNKNDIPESKLEEKELAEIMQSFFNDLPSEQAMCMQLYYYDELSISDITDIFEISPNTVKSRLRLGRNKLQKSICDYEKKHNVKLHAVPIIPLLFKSKLESITIPSSTFIKTAVTGATGVTIGATAGAGTAAATGAKVASAVIARRIIVGVVAASVVATGTSVTVKQIQNTKPAETTVVSTVTTVKHIETTYPYDYIDYDEEERIESLQRSVKYNCGTSAVKYGDYVFHSVLSDTEGDNDNYGAIYKKDLYASENSPFEGEIYLNNVYTIKLLVAQDKLFYLDYKNNEIFMVNLKSDSAEPVKISQNYLVTNTGHAPSTWSEYAQINFYHRNGKILYSAKQNFDEGSKSYIYSYDIKTGKTIVAYESDYYSGIYINTDGIVDETGDTLKLYDENGKIINNYYVDRNIETIYETMNDKFTVDNGDFNIVNNETGEVEKTLGNEDEYISIVFFKGYGYSDATYQINPEGEICGINSRIRNKIVKKVNRRLI